MLCMFVLISGAEVGLLVWENKTLAHKQEVDARWKVIADVKKRITDKITKIDARKNLIKVQHEDQLKTQSLVDFYSRDIPNRVALVQTVLGVLQNTVSDAVIINSLDEFGKRATFKPVAPVLPNTDLRVEIENFNLKAWAISESAAQSFIQELKHGLAPWNLEIRDPQVVARLGPLNLSGFAVVLRVVKLEPLNETHATQVAKR